MKIKNIIILIVVFFSAGVWAQEQPAGEEKQSKIDALAEEVRKLKLAKAAPEAEYKSYSGLGPAASKVYYGSEGLSIGGYGELKYTNYIGQSTDDVNHPNYQNDVFDAHRFILYTGYKFTDKIILNTEIEVEHADEIFLEFANVDFLLHKNANIRAGLLLVPVGLVNEYHEPTVFRGVNRPNIEKVIIPSTWREIGAMLHGDIIWKFDYKLGASTGLDGSGLSDSSWVRGGRTKGSKSNGDNLAFFGRIDFRSNNALVGISGYHGGLNYDPSNFAKHRYYNSRLSDTSVTMADTHLDLQWKGLQFRALGVFGFLDGSDKVSRITGSTVGRQVMGWYAELGYDVYPLFGKGNQALIPFVRYEKYNLHHEVATGATADKNLDQNVITAGIDYKPITQVVIKADFSMLAFESNKADPSKLDTDKKRVNVGLGFIF